LPEQLGVQQPEPAVHTPPQPSLAPQFLPEQLGVQQPEPAVHTPPQPSLAPQFLPEQLGVQQPEPAVQLPPQPSPAPQSLSVQLALQPRQYWFSQRPLTSVQSAQSDPLLPHALSVLPTSQLPSAEQQPLHVAAHPLGATSGAIASAGPSRGVSMSAKTTPVSSTRLSGEGVSAAPGHPAPSPRHSTNASRAPIHRIVVV
jgi:hypothetical protein